MFAWLRRKADKSPADAPVAARLGSIGVVSPWMRAMPTVPWIAGGYMKLLNDGDFDRLISASSAATTGIELHGVRVKGSGIRMARLDNGVAVPNGGMELKLRGYHLLMLLAGPVKVGDKVPVTLTFEQAGDLVVDFLVESPGPVGEPILNQPREG